MERKEPQPGQASRYIQWSVVRPSVRGPRPALYSPLLLPLSLFLSASASFGVFPPSLPRLPQTQLGPH